MRRTQLFVLALVGGLVTGVLGHAIAQAPPALAAPGTGHGFLIDKHMSSGLNCAACHAESPSSKQPDSAALH